MEIKAIFSSQFDCNQLLIITQIKIITGYSRQMSDSTCDT